MLLQGVRRLSFRRGFPGLVLFLSDFVRRAARPQGLRPFAGRAHPDEASALRRFHQSFDDFRNMHDHFPVRPVPAVPFNGGRQIQYADHPGLIFCPGKQFRQIPESLPPCLRLRAVLPDCIRKLLLPVYFRRSASEVRIRIGQRASVTVNLKHRQV